MPVVVPHLRKIFSRKANNDAYLPFKQANYLNQMQSNDLGALVQFSEMQTFMDMAPDIANKRVLFLSQRSTSHVLPKILALHPGHVIHYQLDSLDPAMKKNVLAVKGGLRPLALKSETFEVILFPANHFIEKDMTIYLEELSRVLCHGGRLLLSVVHPFLELLLYNQNPLSYKRGQSSLNKYFQACRDHQLYIENVHEGLVDNTMKPFFKTPVGARTDHLEGMTPYDEFRGIPLTLTFKAVKFSKK